MESGLIASWIGALTGVLALIVTLFLAWNSKKIKLKGFAKLPVIWYKSSDFPCEIEVVNYGVRQMFMSSLNITINAKNSWGIHTDLKIHKIDHLLLTDGEKFHNIFLLNNEMKNLREEYQKNAGWLDKLLPKKIVICIETSKNEEIKINIDDELHKKMINFITK